MWGPSARARSTARRGGHAPALEARPGVGAMHIVQPRRKVESGLEDKAALWQSTLANSSLVANQNLQSSRESRLFLASKISNKVQGWPRINLGRGGARSEALRCGKQQMRKGDMNKA
eukprot:2847-Chlamydomonas_euryale.AAC.1